MCCDIIEIQFGDTLVLEGWAKVIREEHNKNNRKTQRGNYPTEIQKDCKRETKGNRKDTKIRLGTSKGVLVQWVDFDNKEGSVP